MTVRTRFWLVAGSGAAFALTLLLTIQHRIFIAPFCVFIGVVFVGTIFERFRYKRLRDHPPGCGWTETGERFIDPETKKRVTVFYNPQSGERLYVADPGDLPHSWP